jgi:hypothetical protein
MPTYISDDNSVFLSYNRRNDIVASISYKSITAKNMTKVSVPQYFAYSSDSHEIRMYEDIFTLPVIIDAKLYITVDGVDRIIWSGKLNKLSSRKWSSVNVSESY